MWTSDCIRKLKTSYFGTGKGEGRRIVTQVSRQQINGGVVWCIGYGVGNNYRIWRWCIVIANIRIKERVVGCRNVCLNNCICPGNILTNEGTDEKIKYPRYTQRVCVR